MQVSVMKLDICDVFAKVLVTPGLALRPAPSRGFSRHHLHMDRVGQVVSLSQSTMRPEQEQELFPKNQER